MQIWALGRAARLGYIHEQDPNFAYVSASDIPLKGREDIPRPLTIAGMSFLSDYCCHLSRMDPDRNQGVHRRIRPSCEERSVQSGIRRRRDPLRAWVPRRPVHSGDVKQAHGRVRRLYRESLQVRTRYHRRGLPGSRRGEDSHPHQSLEYIPRCVCVT